MSDIDDVRAHPDLERGESELSAATAQLRAGDPPSQTAPVASRVRRAALAAPRLTQLVRAAEPRRDLWISTSVITAVLHDRLAPALLDSAVRRVAIEVDRQEDLESLTVEIVVRYGVPVADDATRARATIEATLDELLGTARSSRGAVGRVHVTDVTVGDPRLVDPADE